MSQGYVHACERAELLGLPIPSEDEWKETQRTETQDANNDNDEVIQVIIYFIYFVLHKTQLSGICTFLCICNINLDSSDEAAQRMGGGLDELNSILSATQKKINRFKTVCGSLGTLLKVKVGSKNNTPDHKLTERNHNETKDIDPETSMNEENLTVEFTDQKHTENIETNTAMPKTIDLNDKMGSHLNKLDSLVTKAENARYSMQYQTKQMKKFLK